MISLGNNFTVDAKRFHCTEAVFHPSFTDAENSGFHDTSLQSNMKYDVYVRVPLAIIPH